MVIICSKNRHCYSYKSGRARCMRISSTSEERMEFGSSLVYAAKDISKAEYEHIPESRYNHTVKAYSSGASGSLDPNDDGEVLQMAV